MRHNFIAAWARMTSVPWRVAVHIRLNGASFRPSSRGSAGLFG